LAPGRSIPSKTGGAASPTLGAFPTLEARMYPVLTYRDADAAIDFLERAFGLTAGELSRGPDGRVVHAELRLGTGLLMLGERAPDAPGPTPGGVWGAADHGVYAVVDDVDAHAARAREAGADVFREPADTPYGSREYSARDVEGHLWSFGTYVPGG
jgi:uncharacterized glyoxalase superfamily protein PhnB